MGGNKLHLQTKPERSKLGHDQGDLVIGKQETRKAGQGVRCDNFIVRKNIYVKSPLNK